jgi:hypothetical protein
VAALRWARERRQIAWAEQRRMTVFRKVPHPRHVLPLFVRCHCGFFFLSEFLDAASLFISYWILW